MHNIYEKKEEKWIIFLKRILICIYFVLSVLESYYAHIIGAVTKYYIIFLVAFLLLDNPRIELKNYHYCFILWFVYKFLTLLWTSNNYIFGIHLPSQIGMLLLFITLTIIKLDEKTLEWIIFTMWGTSALLGVLSLFFSEAYLGFAEARQVVIIFGQETDPNHQAVFLLAGIAISIYFLFYKKHLAFKISSGMILAINLYGIFLTGSRGGLVSAIAIGLFYILFFEKQVSQKQKRIIWISVVAVVLFSFFVARSFLAENTFTRLFDFSQYSSEKEGGGARLVIWRNVWNLIWTDLNFVFGAGWGAYYDYNNMHAVVHNTYLSMWSDVGLIGISLYFVPIIIVFFKLIKRRKILMLALLMTALVPSLFLEAINMKFFWNPIMLIFIQYNLLERANDETRVE